jgi:hypothetical protein
MREKVKSQFFWQRYLTSEADPKKIFMENYANKEEK